MRLPLLAANWKMNKTVSETALFIQEFSQLVSPSPEREVVLCPPFTALQEAAKALKGRFQLGAQNIFWENQGAYTGEISPLMLKEIGCAYVLIAHSERRQYFGETNQTANRKVLAALAHGLRPILCVGETLNEMESGQTRAILSEQIDRGLTRVAAKDFTSITIAYEPVWAIGAGKADTPSQSNATIGFIRSLLGERAGQMRILYGGSVNPANIAAFMAETEIDGALVGGAGLNPESFAKIVNYGKYPTKK